MEDLNINDYKDQLEQICSVCPKLDKCKDRHHICLRKKLVWIYARKEFKKRESARKESIK